MKGKLEKKTFLCIGDIIIDEFIRGDVHRLSPEAPVPILHPKKFELSLGGAGNVARNLCDLGANVFLASVVGKDSPLLKTLLADSDIYPILIEDEERQTPHKIRYAWEGTHLLRVDQETVFPISEAIQAQFLKMLLPFISKSDIIICSDYQKGILMPELLSKIIKITEKHHKPVVIDPKGRDFFRYNGATILSPNRHELSLETGMPCETDEQVEDASNYLLKKLSIKHGVLVTRGEKGLSFISTSGTSIHMTTQTREIYDVSGAGDTVIAILALAVANHFEIEHTMELANLGASIVIGKSGTASVTQTELIDAWNISKNSLPPKKYFFSQQEVIPIIQRWKHEKLKIGFANGCFDILHEGHLNLLYSAASLCDRLIVAVDTDESVRLLKGKERPVQYLQQRAKLLAALEMVDLVISFHGETLLSLIEFIRPDYLIKGEDYALEKIIGRSHVESYGGKVIRIPHLAKVSTTKFLQHIQKTARASF